MVKVLGNATTGYVYNDLGPIDLPRDTNTIRPAHKPWCVDCKRKDRELDVEQRCEQCVRAAVTRAAAAERRAAAAEQAAAAQAEESRAKKIQPSVTTPTKLPTEGKQGQPTTRSSALEALHLLVELTSAEHSPATPAPRPRRAHSGPQRMALPGDDIVEAYKAGQTLGQIAEAHGCSAPTIGRVLEEHGIPRRGAPVPRSPELIEQIRHLYQDEHLTQVEIGERLGQTTKVVQSVMTEAGIDRRAAKARHGRDNARGLKQKIADLGVTSAEIKAWAIAAGHLKQMHRGLPAGSLVEKYAAAHRKDDVA